MVQDNHNSQLSRCNEELDYFLVYVSTVMCVVGTVSDCDCVVQHLLWHPHTSSPSSILMKASAKVYKDKHWTYTPAVELQKTYVL